MKHLIDRLATLSGWIDLADTHGGCWTVRRVDLSRDMAFKPCACCGLRIWVVGTHVDRRPGLRWSSAARYSMLGMHEDICMLCLEDFVGNLMMCDAASEEGALTLTHAGEMSVASNEREEEAHASTGEP